MTFWQNIVLKWKQIQQFCLWALSSDPSGLIESGMYYNTTANRAALRDDTKTQFLAHLEDTYKNAGVIKQPTITKGAGSVTVGNDAVIRCYKTTDYSGIIQEVVNPTGGTFALTENTPLWLVYTYGVGYSVQTSITGPLSNAIPVYRFFNAFGVIHSSTQDEMGVGATEKILVKQTRTEYIKRVGDSGIELSTSALNVLISGGLAYNGPILETILPFNSATNNLYRVVYDDGVWSQTALHALTNTHYNPSTGLAALNSNKYCWAYVWRSVGDDIEAFFQLGEQEYATEELAIKDLGKMPTNIYGLYATHCVLVGYVLIKQGVTTTQYFSAWGRPTVAGAPVYHNTLAGLDAGDPATAYMGHAKLIDNTRMNAAGAANGYALLGADGKLPSGQLPSYVDDVLEHTAKANFPATGENGKIYVDLATNLTWRWSGTTYVEISPSLALGETSATAYRGDRGKAAYDHSQFIASNPHGTTAAQIPSVATGDVSATNVQAAIAELASSRDYWLKSNSGFFGGVELSENSFKNNYRGLSVAGTFEDNYRLTFMAGDRAGVKSAGLYCDTLTAWAILVNNGKLTTGFTPPTSADDEQIPTTAWVKDVAAPIDTTLSDSAASSTLPTTTSGSLVSKIQQIRDYLKYLLSSVNSVSGDYVSKSVGTLQTIVSDLVTGKSHIGSWSVITDYARVGHKDFNTMSGFGFLQSDDGRVYIETPAAMPITLRQDGVAKLTIADNGHTQIVTPPTSADDNTAVTSAWVKDVAAPIDATLTNESGQDVLPTGTYSVVALLQWFRNNLSQLFSAVAGKAPTNHASTATTYGASSASLRGHAMASSENPLMDGTASPGIDNGKYTREGHVHPNDNTKMTVPKNYIGGLSTSQTITPTDGDVYLINGSGLTITLSNSAQALSNVYLIYNATCGYSQHTIQFYDFFGNLKVLKTRPYTGTVENSTIMARKVLNGWIVTGY